MSGVTFDTLKFSRKLREGGFTEQQAEALSEAQKEALSESLETSLASRTDIFRIEAEIKLIKWMIGATFAAVMAVLVRLFMGHVA
ncbi:MAG: hypothetical protein CO125_00250 [Hydrogenophilales bacterium CG_4_9_14_3_um_filter_59_35]|nr:MAG: hypothetical protein COW70_03695 [Hydrogenophilales bacterium CG18_big_fil_WC_8_21_14_2_50_58_12]PIX99816.1 MAG: hypothetical protein COZ23_10085 [Hydrogenophilales bacterium CG_4_10_14_3_um_filter_58_23]PJB08949.1 MAG: hypothetical protein CO125_00250 [Hydrogenophilales bacterium CG_4_9_14_3_um_filter_59_35]